MAATLKLLNELFCWFVLLLFFFLYVRMSGVLHKLFLFLFSFSDFLFTFFLFFSFELNTRIVVCSIVAYIILCFFLFCFFVFTTIYIFDGG